MKRTLILLLAMVLMLLFCACSQTRKTDAPKTDDAGSSPVSEVSAPSSESGSTESDEPAAFTVFVTIVDSNGKVALTQQAVEVKDFDGNDVYTIDEALTSAHDSFFEGGAASGYLSEETQYGLSIMKLWGSDGYSSFGYYVNHEMAMSLADPLKEGDLLDAYVFTDLTAFSDKYTYFDQPSVKVAPQQEVKLTLYVLGFDENWTPVYSPAPEGVTVTVNGENTETATDADGSLTLSFDESGNYVVSIDGGSLEGYTFVPNVCLVSVE